MVGMQKPYEIEIDIYVKECENVGIYKCVIKS